ncbi:unnamed protein product [Cyclocybe aegerita]|uniref:HNH nuclease domain-containing protein n=1 Tax=Cyclocybe aegerita TaxID=1973307 RepID=A0A8S0VU72_CYCAE|nr:unnamed protein product [Cyclocybe aegerita]
MSNRALTPPRRLDTHIQPEDTEGPHDEADSQSDPNPSTPPTRKRHLDDEPYIPDAPGSQSDAKGKTPKKRKKTASSLPSYVKQNVILEVATMHGVPPKDARPQCFISRASDEMTVLEFSHVTSGSTPAKEMDCLEWAWKRKYYTLNVDTRKNIQTLRISLHRWFDKTKGSKPVGWFWLPVDLNIVLHMYAAYVGSDVILPEAGTTANVRKDPQVFYKSEKFQYQLIPLPDMKLSWSVKHYTADPLRLFDPSLINYSVYPFDDLPPFELHVPYHFVIANTGKKLFQLYGYGTIDFQTHFYFLSPLAKNMMRAVRNIYVAWMMATPNPKWLSGEGYDDEQDSAAEQTHLRGGAGSDGGPQGRGAPSGGKGGMSRAQDAAPHPSGTPMGQRRPTAESLAPCDSASCLGAFELVDEVNGKDEDKPFVDDEDEEYEDDEFFMGLEQWASDVWTATRSGSDSGSDSAMTLVGAAAPAFCKGVDVVTLETPPYLSV